MFFHVIDIALPKKRQDVFAAGGQGQSLLFVSLAIWRLSLRDFFWRHAEWWPLALSALAWCYLAFSWSNPPAHHHRFQLGPVVVHWAAMMVAMMLPLMAGHVSLVARRSLWHRRHRAAAIFVAAYLFVWLLYGLVVSEVFERGMRPNLVNCLLAAAYWQTTPFKRSALLACHRTLPLAPSGWEADRDCVRYGWTVAGSCLLSCWLLMLACAADHSASLDVGLAAFLLRERIVVRLHHQHEFAVALLMIVLFLAARPFW